MKLEEKYFKLCYTERIHEYRKIDVYKNWPSGEAHKKYKRLDEFYQEELQIDADELIHLRTKFKEYDNLYTKYYNNQRKELFAIPDKLVTWHNSQNDSCYYCELTQSDLLRIVAKRGRNLTLNKKTKRSKGTLEIEKLDPNQEYTFENSVLSCPFCNNAKSNLISEEDWRAYFVPAMKQFLKKQLSE